MYGSVAYVMKMAVALGHCFKAKGVAPHGLVGLPAEAGASVLGWKCIFKREMGKIQIEMGKVDFERRAAG